MRQAPDRNDPCPAGNETKRGHLRRDESPPRIMPAACATEQVLRQQDARRADEPGPVFRGQTTRRAIATPAGLKRWHGLRRGCQGGEYEVATQIGRGAAPFRLHMGTLETAP